MSSYGEGLAWIVLSPLAILTDFFAIGFVCHYRPFYHGSDVMIVSLLVAMAMNALLVVPIPAFTELDYFQWNSILCKFYVWAFLTFRIAQMLTLSAICVHWSAIIQASTKNQNKGLTYRIKILSVAIWILSIIIGLLPIIGAVPDNFFKNGSCMFLSSDIGIGFTIFIFIFVITCMLTAIISICDVTFFTKCMRKTARVRYGTDRFYLPKKNSEVPTSGSYSIHEKFNQLNFTWDLCRFFCFVISFCFIGNHLPFAILEFVQSTTLFNRDLVQEIILWLILIEALVFPHLLWTCSRRYRHALVYTWRVHIMKRPREEEEDPTSCRLQSYSRKVRDVNGYVNNLSDVPDVTRNIPTPDPKTNDVQSNFDNNTTGSQEIVLQAVHNGRIEYHRSESTPSRKCQDVSHNNTKPEISLSTFHTAQTHTHTRNNSGGPTIKMGTADVHKSSPSGSRQEWKEQMRKKHLPPIFTNDSFHADINVLDVPQENINRSEGACGSAHSLYYLSGDYHPDYLNTDSLPRHRLPDGFAVSSESEEDTIDNKEGDDIQVLKAGTVKSQKPEVVHKIKPEIKPKPKILKGTHNQNAVTNHSVNQENKKCIAKATSGQSKNTYSDKRQPVSPDEIDIYIYHAADGRNSHISKTTNSKNENEERHLDILNSAEKAYTLQSAKGIESHHNDPTNELSTETCIYHERHLSKENWNEMVQPILEKNENDELDVSLNSCDQTWQNLRNQRPVSKRPVSHSPFDVETDRGFEEALSVEYESVRSISSLTNESFGDSFDTSNPFEYVDNFKNESFKTQAIVSKSRPTSCTTVEGDNPFDYVPIETKHDVIKRASDNVEGRTNQKPSFSTFKSHTFNKNFDNEHFDEVFGVYDSRSFKTSTPNRNSPWPSAQGQDVDNASPWPTIPEHYGDNDFVFESDFNTNRVEQSTTKKKQKSNHSFSGNTRYDNTRFSGSQLDNTSGITMDVEPISL